MAPTPRPEAPNPRARDATHPRQRSFAQEGTRTNGIARVDEVSASSSTGASNATSASRVAREPDSRSASALGTLKTHAQPFTLLLFFVAEAAAKRPAPHRVECGERAREGLSGGA